MDSWTTFPSAFNGFCTLPRGPGGRLVWQVARQHFLQRPILPPPFVQLEHSAIVDSVEYPALVGLELLPAMGELKDPAMVGLELPAMVGLDRLLLPQLCLLHRSVLREWGLVFQELHEIQPELH